MMKIINYVLIVFLFMALPKCIVNASGVETTQTPEATNETVSETKYEIKTSKKSKKKKITTVTISAAGDCTLGVDSRFNSTFNEYYNQKGSNYFLKKVKKVFAKDDLTIVNFEGTLTNSYARANKQYTFKGPAKHVKILKKGSVEVVTLANNHTSDYGSQGLIDTKNTLKKNKIKYCYNSTIAYKKVKGVKVAFIGFSQLAGVSESQVDSAIKEAKKKKAKIIIMNIHWGEERVYYPTGRQTYLGRYAIRAGADLVLGHHPHVLQGVEKYKGRYIVYSLGNFCFGANKNPSDKDTLIVQETYSFDANGNITNVKANIIPCKLSSTNTKNDYKPTIETNQNEVNRILEKLKKHSKKYQKTLDVLTN